MLISASLMNPFYLKHFYHIAHLGSFTKAAKQLHTSQPNLSRSVRLLEEGCGKTLMLRNKGGITLSEDGKSVYTAAKEIFERLDALESSFTGKQGDHTLRIGASENLSIHAIPSLIKELLASSLCSNVSLFSGTAEQIEEQVNELQLDLGIFYNPPRSAALKQQIISEVEFKLVFPKGKGVKDTKNLPYIGSRKSDYSAPYFALKALQQNGIAPSKIIETNSQEAQVEMAKMGIGYTVIPEFLAKKSEKYLHIDRTFKAKSKLHLVFRNTINPKLSDLIKNTIRTQIKC